MVQHAVIVDKDARTITCPCGEVVALPNLDESPVLRAGGQVWWPKLVAVRCTGCKKELRLD